MTVPLARNMSRKAPSFSGVANDLIGDVFVSFLGVLLLTLVASPMAVFSRKLSVNLVISDESLIREHCRPIVAEKDSD
jgi:hypothetical protein